MVWLSAADGINSNKVISRIGIFGNDAGTSRHLRVGPDVPGSVGIRVKGVSGQTADL